MECGHFDQKIVEQAHFIVPPIVPVNQNWVASIIIGSTTKIKFGPLYFYEST